MKRLISKRFYSDVFLTHARARLCVALRESFREGYGFREFKKDAIAGIIVGIVALPLSMALAIATGLPPEYGIYTSVVAGILTAVFGGSRVQISGPTAAFIVILVPIVVKFGFAGLALATMIAGLMLMAMGLSGMGRLIAFIPNPVTTGFTAGIAVVIATIQVKDFLGLDLVKMPNHFLEKLSAMYGAMPSFRISDAVVGLVTLAILIVGNRRMKKIPAPLLALAAASVLGILIEQFFPGSGVITIKGRFATSYAPDGIPHGLPFPDWPWHFHAPSDVLIAWSPEVIKEIILAAFAIAVLGAIESLLSATIADGMTRRTHDPNAELVGQGVGNIVAPFFGGFAATGAIARTATGVRFGAISPIACVIHSVFILFAVFVFAPFLGYLPMASLAALLLMVAWHMSEARHFAHTLRIAPRSDVVVLLLCFGLTVFFDMVVAVMVGVMLAAVLFMRRMAEVGGARLVSSKSEEHGEPLPAGIFIYEIAGPLFFGAAQKAMSEIGRIRNLHAGVKVVIIDMRNVPFMDMTGLVNLTSALELLEKHGTRVILAGVNKQPIKVIAKAHLQRDKKLLTVSGSFVKALQDARDAVAGA